MSSIGNAAAVFFFVIAIGLAVNGRRGVGLAAMAGWACGLATMGSGVFASPAQWSPEELALRSLAVTGIAFALVGFGRRIRRQRRPG